MKKEKIDSIQLKKSNTLIVNGVISDPDRGFINVAVLKSGPKNKSKIIRTYKNKDAYYVIKGLFGKDTDTYLNEHPMFFSICTYSLDFNNGYHRFNIMDVVDNELYHCKTLKGNSAVSAYEILIG